MSYSIMYSRMSAFFLDEEYSFFWPEKVSESSRTLLKNILYSYNRKYLRMEKCGLDQRQLPGGVYFFLLEEGAVLFKVGGYESDTCYGAALIGLFFEREYVTTAWLMIDKLVRLITVGDLDLLGEDKASEKEIDELFQGKNCRDFLINPNGEEQLYSFAIAPMDPCRNGVRYFSNFNGKAEMDRAAGHRKNNTFESVFSLKSIFRDQLLEDKYENVYLERTEKEKTGFFKLSSFGRTWGIRSSDDCDKVCFKELECIEDGKAISFSALVDEVDSIIGLCS